jgi:hypothetical protein
VEGTVCGMNRWFGGLRLEVYLMRFGLRMSLRIGDVRRLCK